MYLASRPFNLTGSLRENIDPLGQHRDRDILRALSHFHIDDPLRWKFQAGDEQPSQHFLDQRINFEDISTTMRNSISVVRALLRQPKILVCENLQPNRCIVSPEDLLAERLREVLNK
jgi:ABC-type multidrug transport system fused ATPase/permease subunit